MSRLREVVERWKGKAAAERAKDAEGVAVVVADVVKAVESYERTIADLKRQNEKARRRAARQSGSVIHLSEPTC